MPLPGNNPTENDSKEEGPIYLPCLVHEEKWELDPQLAKVSRRSRVAKYSQINLAIFLEPTPIFEGWPTIITQTVHALWVVLVRVGNGSCSIFCIALHIQE